MKKMVKRPMTTGIEDYGYDKSDEFFKNKYDAKALTKDFIPLTTNVSDVETDNEDEDMKAMGLEGHREVSDNDDESDQDDGSVEDMITMSGEQKDDRQGMKFIRRDWGKKAEDYYEANLDSDCGDNASDGEHDAHSVDSDLAIQEEEALEFQQEQLKHLRHGDFDREDLLLGAGLDSDDGHRVSTSGIGSTFEKELESILAGLDTSISIEELQKLGRHDDAKFKVNPLSVEERQLIIQKQHPEFCSLMKEMRDKSLEVNERIAPLLQRVELRELLTSEGLSFLEMKHHLLLCYLQYLCYYILLKLNGHSIANHPVIERLVEVKLLLNKIKPIETKLQTQISELLSFTADQSLKTPAQRSVSLRKQPLKPRPDLLVPFGAEDSVLARSAVEHKSVGLLGSDNDTNDDDDDDDDDDDGDDAEDAEDDDSDYHDDLDNRHPPHHDETVTSKKTKIYQPPRLISVEYVDKKKTPLELGGTSISELANRSGQSKRLLERLAEREAFEEEYMFRLPTTKTDNKARRVLKEKQKLFLAGGSTLEELTSFADAAMDSTFDDPSVGRGPRTKSTLTASLSAVQQESDKLLRKDRTKRKGLNSSDTHVTAKVVDRRKRHAADADGHFGGRDETETDFKRSHKNQKMEMKGVEIPNVVHEALEQRKLRKEAKRAHYNEQQLKTLPKLPNTVADEKKRASSYQMDRNKGLVRKRKAIEGSARAHNRLKYEKKIKKLKGTHQEVRDGLPSGNYFGESTGMKTHLKRSIALAE